MAQFHLNLKEGKCQTFNQLIDYLPYSPKPQLRPSQHKVREPLPFKVIFQKEFLQEMIKHLMYLRLLLVRLWSLPEPKAKKKEKVSVPVPIRALTNPSPLRMRASALPTRQCRKWRKATMTARAWTSPPPSVASNARELRLLPLPNRQVPQSTHPKLPDLAVPLKVQREERREVLEPHKLAAPKLNRFISRSPDRDQGNKNE